MNFNIESRKTFKRNIKMKMTRTPSKNIVQVLDLSGLCERATASKNKSDITRLKRGEKLEHAFTWGVVEVAGLHYLINDEGVGSYEPLENENDSIPWYTHAYNYAGTEVSFGIMPCIESVINYDGLLSNSTVVDNVPLDKFIRTFGSRLDSNYNSMETYFNRGGIKRELSTGIKLELSRD